jgi:hypothetical protein
MNKRIFYPLLFVAVAGWLVKDDLSFFRLALGWKNTQLVQGQVTRKFSRPQFLIRGIAKTHYFVEVTDLLHTCSGTSRISEATYNDLNSNDALPLRRLNQLCLATVDIHMYTPPVLQFIPAGITLLFACLQLALLVRDLLRERRAIG